MAAIDQQLDQDGGGFVEKGSEQDTGATPVSGASPEPEAQRSPTRLSAAWTAVVIATLLLVALVVFIAQNTQRSSVNFFGAHGTAPTAVVLLIAALSGAVIVIVVGIARILQLRRRTGHLRRRPGASH